MFVSNVPCPVIYSKVKKLKATSECLQILVKSEVRNFTKIGMVVVVVVVVVAAVAVFHADEQTDRRGKVSAFLRSYFPNASRNWSFFNLCRKSTCSRMIHTMTFSAHEPFLI